MIFLSGKSHSSQKLNKFSWLWKFKDKVICSIIKHPW